MVIITPKLDTPPLLCSNPANRTPRGIRFRPAPRARPRVAFAQVQPLQLKSSAFWPSPGAFGQVQDFSAKSRRLSQVQAFGPKSRRFGPSPGALGQVQPLWSKSSLFGPSPRLFYEFYRVLPKSSLFCPSPA